MTPDQLMLATGCTADRAARYANALTQCMQFFGIDTPLRRSHFLAQIAHETGRLQWVRELASGQAYEGRKDLGNVQAGDGVRFKGRGLLQTTGRANYRELKTKLEGYGYLGIPDFELEPQRLEEPMWAAASAGLYWATRGISRLADADDVIGVTKRINGGTNGLDDRKLALTRAKGVLCKP